MTAFREQITVTQANENKFVVDRLPALQDQIEKIVEAMTKKVSSGKFRKEDLAALQLSINEAKDLIKLSAELLGYAGNGEAPMRDQTSGKNSNGWGHILPKPPKKIKAKQEVEEAKVVEVEETE